MSENRNSYFISDKWCFEHTGLASIREYDKNINNCCICLEKEYDNISSSMYENKQPNEGNKANESIESPESAFVSSSVF